MNKVLILSLKIPPDLALHVVPPLPHQVQVATPPTDAPGSNGLMQTQLRQVRKTSVKGFKRTRVSPNLCTHCTWRRNEVHLRNKADSPTQEGRPRSPNSTRIASGSAPSCRLEKADSRAGLSTTTKANRPRGYLPLWAMKLQLVPISPDTLS